MFEFVIYSLAGKDIASALESTNMIMNTSGFKTFMAVGALIGFIYFLIRYITHTTDVGKEGKTLIIIYVLIFGFLIPKTDVHVRDITRGVTYIVGDTSLGLGLIASMITNITYFQTKITATANSSPATSIDPYSMNGGYLSPIQYIYLLREISYSKSPIETSPEMVTLSNNLTSYMNGCYIPYLERTGVPNADMHTATRPDLWSSMHVPMYAWAVKVEDLEVNGTKESGMMLCPDVHTALSTELMKPYVKNGLLDHLIDATRKSNNIVDPSIAENGSTRTPEAQRAYFEDMMESVLFGSSSSLVLNTEGTTFSDGILTYENNSNSSGTSSVSDMSSDAAGAIMRNLYLFRIYNALSSNYYSRSINTNSYQATLFDGLAHKNLSMANGAWSFGQYMIPVIGFIEVLIYSLLPMAIFLMLSLSTNGLKTVGMYVMAFYWVALWPYSYILIHKWIVDRFLEATDKLLTSSSIKDISDVLIVAQNELGAGGMWIGLVPVLTLFIVKGSMYTFNTIATQIQGAEKMNEQNMHRDTHSYGALYDMQGDQMQAARMAFGGSLGVGNNANNYEKGLQTTYNTGSQVKAAVDHQQKINETATSTYQGSISDVAGYAAKHGISSDNKWGFQLKENDSYGETNGASFQAAQQLAKDLGLNLDKSSLTSLAGNIAGGVGAKLGFNAEAKLAHVDQDLQKAGVSQAIVDKRAEALADNDEYRKAWAKEASLTKDQSFDEKNATEDERKYQSQLSATHDEKISSDRALARVNSLSENMNMSQEIQTAALGNAIQNAIHDPSSPEKTQEWSQLTSNSDVKRLTEEKLDNPAFRQIYQNNRYSDGGGGLLSQEESLKLSAQMEAVREHAYLESDPTQVATMLSIPYENSGTYTAEGSTAQPTNERLESFTTSTGASNPNDLITEAKEVEQTSHTVAQDAQTATTNAQDKLDEREKARLAAEKAAYSNQNVKTDVNQHLTAKSFEEAKEQNELSAELGDIKIHGMADDTKLSKEANKLHEMAYALNINLNEAERLATESAVVNGPMVNATIDGMKSSSDPEVRAQALEIEKAQERLSQEVKQGDVSLDTYLNFQEQVAKGAAAWGEHGIELAKQEVKEVVMDDYFNDNKERFVKSGALTPEQIENYEDADYQDKVAMLLQASPEYKYGDDVSESLKGLLVDHVKDQGEDLSDKFFTMDTPGEILATAVTETGLDVGAAAKLREDASSLVSDRERAMGGTAGFFHKELTPDSVLEDKSIRDAYKQSITEYGAEGKLGFYHLSEGEQIEWLAQHHPVYKEALDKHKANYGGEVPESFFSKEKDYSGAMEYVLDKEYSSGSAAYDAALKVAAKPSESYEEIAEYMEQKGSLTGEQKSAIDKADTPAKKAKLLSSYLEDKYGTENDKSLTDAEKILKATQRMERELEVSKGTNNLNLFEKELKDASSLISQSVKEGEGYGVLRDKLIKAFSSDEIASHLVGKELSQMMKEGKEIAPGALSSNPQESIEALTKTNPEMRSVYEKAMSENHNNKAEAAHEVYKALLIKHSKYN